jgi:parallel beta-helix repeat protein/putative cofactor-binding repeat protein/predicted outer membrane repeat protein
MSGKTIRVAFFCLPAFLCLAGAVQAAVIYVPDNHPTIQDAVCAAQGGDTIIVRPGTYVENVDFLGKAVTLKSETGPASTTIDGNQSGGVVSFCSGEGAASVLEGFTLTNGSGTYDPGWGNYYGGGVFCTGASPTIVNNIITGNSSNGGGGICCHFDSAAMIANNTITKNTSQRKGGGIRCYKSRPTVTGNTISLNTGCEQGGGIFCIDSDAAMVTDNIITENMTFGYGGGIYCDHSSPPISGNRISGNSSSRGGGIYCSSSSPAITDNSISGNVSSYDGGGIYCRYSDSVISGNAIEENSASGGGGISCQGNCDISISGNIISGNTATGGFDGGGGIAYMSSVPTVIADNIVTGNTATHNGGGINCFADSSTIRGNVITGNSTTGFGGGVICDGDCVTVTDNTISGNSAGSGGGIYCRGITPVMTNNVITHNTADNGGGICCIGGTNQIIESNTISENLAATGGGICCFCFATPLITNTILWDNNSPKGPEIAVMNYNSQPAGVIISYSDVKGGQASVYVDPGAGFSWKQGMIDADPLFTGPANDDFHLTWPSPCRDAGDNSASHLPSEDMEGDPRVAQGAVDMGSDEFFFHLYYSGSIVPGGSMEIKAVGWPTAPVTLALGSGIQDPPLSTPHGDLHILWPPVWQGNIGAVPATGVLTFPATVPPWWSQGEERPFQALVGPWGGAFTGLTNLMVLPVE